MSMSTSLTASKLQKDGGDMKSVMILGLLVSVLSFLIGGRQIPGPYKYQPALQEPPKVMMVASREGSAGRLESLILQLMNEGDVPGLSIALIRDGKLSWHKAFGVKNAETKEALAETTVFEAASLSKPVFAYAVLKLIDRGRLDLDRPLSSYISSAYLPDDRVKLITTRMVLAHTTGFQNEVTPAKPLRIYFTPGDKFSYSGKAQWFNQRNLVCRVENFFLPLGKKPTRVWKLSALLVVSVVFLGEEICGCRYYQARSWLLS